MPNRNVLASVALAGLLSIAFSCAEAETQVESAGTGGASIGAGPGTGGNATGGATSNDGGVVGPLGDSSTIIGLDGAPVGSVGDATLR